MTLSASDNCTFNIAGETFSLKELAGKIAAIYGTPVTYIPWNDLDWKIESGSTVFDGEKLEGVIRIESQWTFDLWLQEIKVQ